jgi:hypothetical protein
MFNYTCIVVIIISATSLPLQWRSTEHDPRLKKVEGLADWARDEQSNNDGPTEEQIEAEATKNLSPTGVVFSARQRALHLG